MFSFGLHLENIRLNDARITISKRNKTIIFDSHRVGSSPLISPIIGRIYVKFSSVLEYNVHCARGSEIISIITRSEKIQIPDQMNQFEYLKELFERLVEESANSDKLDERVSTVKKKLRPLK